MYSCKGRGGGGYIRGICTGLDICIQRSLEEMAESDHKKQHSGGNVEVEVNTEPMSQYRPNTERAQ